MPTRQTTLPGTQGCPALSQDILHLSRSRHPTRNHFRAEVLAIFTRNHTAKPTLFRFPSSFISNLADQELPNAIGVTTSSQVCDRVREREREREMSLVSAGYGPKLGQTIQPSKHRQRGKERSLGGAQKQQNYCRRRSYQPVRTAFHTSQLSCGDHPNAVPHRTVTRGTFVLGPLGHARAGTLMPFHARNGVQRCNTSTGAAPTTRWPRAVFC
jgi:hypothetical protein